MRLEEGEHVVTIIRKHWLVFALNVVGLMLVAFLPFLLIAVFPADLVAQAFALPDAGSAASFLYFGWLLCIWLLLFSFWTTYYLDIWVVTNRRVVDIDQKTLFRREMVSARLEKIQDITVEVHGGLPTLFGYGRMRI